MIQWLKMLFGFGVAKLPKAPPVTDEMRQRGLTWRYVAIGPEHEWVEVCDFCGGNCGQCGLTGRIMNVPASMDRMVQKLMGQS